MTVMKGANTATSWMDPAIHAIMVMRNPLYYTKNNEPN